ncbi:MAG: hypothetical protein AB1547_11655 [Thermodesulfobacteriota bacterium]
MNLSQVISFIEVACILIMSSAIYRRCFNRDRRFPIDDMGFVWLILADIYILIPFMMWLILGCEYSPVHGRLYQIQPEWDEVAYIIKIGLSYITGFSFIYLFLIHKVRILPNSGIPEVDRYHVIGAATIVFGSLVIQLAVQGSGVIDKPSSYIEQYFVVQQLPLNIRQLIKISSGWANVAMVILIVALVQRWPRQRWLLFFYIVYLVAIYDPTGSRAGVTLGLFSLLVSWHVLVRPFSVKSILLVGGMGLIVFSILGWYRNYGSLGDLFLLSRYDLSAGEFDSLWGNAVEVLRSRTSVQPQIPWYIRYEEFFGFVPSQVLWFPKNSLSNWFLDEFHPLYKDQGGGLAFGIIAQAIVGGGIFEGFIRGAALGYILGKVMTFFRSKMDRWWVFPLQVYLLTWMFQNVRSTSFALLTLVVQLVLPALIITYGIGLVIRPRV